MLFCWEMYKFLKALKIMIYQANLFFPEESATNNNFDGSKLKEGACSLFFRPRTRPKTFLQCFALYFLCSKAKHCRNVLGRVLGRKNKLHALSFSYLDLQPKTPLNHKRKESAYILLYIIRGTFMTWLCAAKGNMNENVIVEFSVWVQKVKPTLTILYREMISQQNC